MVMSITMSMSITTTTMQSMNIAVPVATIIITKKKSILPAAADILTTIIPTHMNILAPVAENTLTNTTIMNAHVDTTTMRNTDVP